MTESSTAMMCINRISSWKKKGDKNIFHVGLTPAQWENTNLEQPLQPTADFLYRPGSDP